MVATDLTPRQIASIKLGRNQRVRFGIPGPGVDPVADPQQAISNGFEPLVQAHAPFGGDYFAGVVGADGNDTVSQSDGAGQWITSLVPAEVVGANR